MADIDITVALNDRASQQLRNLDRAARGVTNTLRLAAGAAAAFATGAVVQGIVGQYRAYERYRTVLTTFLGTQDKANAELARLQKLADTLPQDLSDITEAFTIFSRFGIDTSAQSLTAFSNIATANAKSLTQLGEAVADALTGEFERLKEFGIKVSRENDGFVARIGEQQVAVATTSKDLVNQLKALGLEGGKFAGAAAANADTLNQSISNLQGALFTTSVSIMEEFGPALKDVVNDLSEVLRNNQDLATSIGTGLKTALEGTVSAVKLAVENLDKLKAIFVFLVTKKLISTAATSMVAFSNAMKVAAGSAGILSGALRVVSLAFTPFRIFSLVLSGVVASFVFFQDTVVNVGDTVSSLGEVALATFNILKSGAVNAFNTFGKVATDTFNSAVTSATNFFNSFGIDLGSVFNNALSTVRKFSVNAIAGVATFFQFQIRNIKIVGEVFRSVFVFMGNKFKELIDFMSKLFSPLFNVVKQFVTSFADSFKAMFQAVKSFITPIVDIFRDVFVGIGENAKRGLNFIINTFDFSFATVKAIIMNIPRFFVEAFDGILTTMKGFGNILISRFQGFGKAAMLAFKAPFSREVTFDDAVAALAPELGQTFGEAFRDGIGSVGSLIPEGAVDKDAIFAQDKVGDTLQAAADFATDVGNNIKTGLTETLEGAASMLDNVLFEGSGGDFSLMELRNDIKASLAQINTDFENNKNTINGFIDAIDINSFDELKAKIIQFKEAFPDSAFVTQIETALEAEIVKMREAKKAALEAAKATDQYDDAILRMSRNQKTAGDNIKETTNKINEQSEAATNTAKTVAETLEDSINNLAGSMSSTLTDAFLGIKNGFEALEDIALSVVKTIVNTLTQEFLVKPLLKEIAAAIGGAFGGTSAGGGLGSLFGALGAIPGLGPFAALAGLGVFLGSRANGGPVSSNRPYIVGERGPELFLPNQNGQIVSNEQLNTSAGTGDLTVNFNLQSIDTQTGTEFLLQNKRVITGVVQDAFRRRAQAGPLG